MQPDTETEEMATGGDLKGKGKSTPVGFRCPSELATWVEGRSGDGVSVSAAYVFTLEQGRDLIEAAGPDILRKLDGYAAVFGQERRTLLKRILADGMTALERELRSNARKT